MSTVEEPPPWKLYIRLHHIAHLDFLALITVRQQIYMGLAKP